MKFKYLLLALFATAFLSSYISDFGRIKVGSEAPEIIFSDDSNQSDRNIALQGYRLVSFWSPAKPASRIANKEFSNYFAENPDSPIEFISICSLNDDFIGQEILKIDNIDSTGHHLLYSDVDNRVFKDYKVDDNPTSFLIDPSGKIKAISPSIEQLKI